MVSDETVKKVKTGLLIVALIIVGTVVFVLNCSAAGDTSAIKINSTIEDSRAALEWINEIRVDNGSAPIKFDERAYWLAMHQCKDMEDYNYYYHTNPETLEWVASWKADYGFYEDEYPVDNLACNTIFTYANYNDENLYSEVEAYAITGWIESPGHYYNLVYPHHKSGAFVIYRDTAVFIGVNTDGYGSEYMEPLSYVDMEIENRYYKGY